MQNLIAIALGGSAGALARFYTATGIQAWLGRDFPHGTLFVNVSGSFLMGFLTQLLLLRYPDATALRSAVLVGFLGAYTTFSTFSLETFTLLDEGRLLKATTYATLSIVLCIVATWMGMLIGRRVFSLEWPTWLSAVDAQAWVRLGAVLGLGFIFGLMSEWAFLRYEWILNTRTIIILSVLGVLTVTHLVLIVPTLAGHPLEHHAVLPWFLASALGSGVSVWAGMAVARP